jgi:hypothetical protein
MISADSDQRFFVHLHVIRACVGDGVIVDFLFYQVSARDSVCILTYFA